MTIKQELFIVFVIGLTVYVTSNICPPKEKLPDCQCSIYPESDLDCGGWHTGRTIEDYREILLSNFDEDEHLQLKFSNFNKESRLPSKVFDGLRVKSLEIKYSNVSKWADVEGGPAFLGLEDTLEKFKVHSTVKRPDKKYVEEHKEFKALMSLGHLRKLREVEFTINNIYNFDNNWFGKGGNSVEDLTLHLCHLYYLGDEAFSGLISLKTIELNSNYIQTVTRSMFPNPAKHLKYIHLMDNKLKALPNDMFTNMPSLTLVDLQANSLSHISENVWRPVWLQLKDVNFSYNKLICDDHLDWIYKVRQPEYFYARCYYPYGIRGKDVNELIKEKQVKETIN